MTKTLKRYINPLFFLVLFSAFVIFVVIARNNVPRGERPNIVWIVIDALRADHLGCYGYGRDTSSFIDGFAGKGILFEHAFSQESYTQASVASFFTSTYPWVNKVLYDKPMIDVLDPAFVTIAEILKEAGYDTAAFVFNPHLKAIFNFGQGFDLYSDGGKGLKVVLRDPGSHETAKKISAKVKRYLERTGGKRPVFLYLHYRDVHGPYMPPPPYDSVFPGPDSAYDGEIRYADNSIRALFTLLKGYGIDNRNSVIIVTADHGEEFYDDPPPDKRSPGGHGRTLYNELIHVPLIMSIPGLPAGKRIGAYVGLIDIAPTLCDILKIDRKRYGRFQGMTLLPVINGEDDGHRPVYGGGKYGRGFVIRGGYKYYIDLKNKTASCMRPADNDNVMREELYDMNADFNEVMDLSGARPDIVSELRKELEAFIKGSPVYGGLAASVWPDARTEEELRSLGYLQ
ncbi:MAG: sulfatase [Candidatus Omnitrophota bacterium]